MTCNYKRFSLAWGCEVSGRVRRRKAPIGFRRPSMLIYAALCWIKKSARVCADTLTAGMNKKIPVKLSCGTLLRAAAARWGMWHGCVKPLCKAQWVKAGWIVGVKRRSVLSRRTRSDGSHWGFRRSHRPPRYSSVSLTSDPRWLARL